MKKYYEAQLIKRMEQELSMPSRGFVDMRRTVSCFRHKDGINLRYLPSPKDRLELAGRLKLRTAWSSYSCEPLHIITPS